MLASVLSDLILITTKVNVKFSCLVRTKPHTNHSAVVVVTGAAIVGVKNLQVHENILQKKR